MDRVRGRPLRDGQLQGIGGPDDFLKDRVKEKIVGTVNEVFSHAPGGVLVVNRPYGAGVEYAPQGRLKQKTIDNSWVPYYRHYHKAKLWSGYTAYNGNV